MECFLNLPKLEEMNNPLDMQRIQNHQLQDKELQDSLDDYNKYKLEGVSNMEVITFWEKHDKPWKICIPGSLINKVIHWYHNTLGHCSTTRLYDTIKA